MSAFEAEPPAAAPELAAADPAEEPPAPAEEPPAPADAAEAPADAAAPPADAAAPPADAAALAAAFPQFSAADVARFVAARAGDLGAARDLLAAHAAWREAFVPTCRADDPAVVAELRKGRFFARGRDRAGRPVVYYRSRTQDPKERDLDEARARASRARAPRARARTRPPPRLL